MTYLKIQNKGEIGVEAFTLLGVSTKRDDNTKIGFFGSGLKYALAYLLRNKIKFRVFSGYREIKFDVKKVTFRGQTFHQILVNGQDTSMTIEMGPNWKPWYAIREIYCNALDEGEVLAKRVKEEDAIPVEDHTVFYVEVTKEIQETLSNWERFFSDGRKDVLYQDIKGNTLFAGGDDLIVYRKGIQVMFKEKQKCLFHPDMIWIEINESREIDSDYGFRCDLAKFYARLSNRDIVQKLLQNILNHYESKLEWSYYGSHFSDTWRELLQDKILVHENTAGNWTELIHANNDKYIILPDELVKALSNRWSDLKVLGRVREEDYEYDLVTDKTNKETRMLEQCVAFLKSAGYPVDKYEIEIVKFKDNKIYGMAILTKDKIAISKDCFLKGKKFLVSTLLEEYIHLETRFEDETRTLETYLFDLIVTLLEDKLGTIL